MKQCAIYIPVSEIKMADFFADKNYETQTRFFSSPEKGEWEKIELLGKDFKITINRMDYSDPNFQREVEGLCNYIFFLGNQTMSENVFTLTEKIQRTQMVLGLVFEPDFDQKGTWRKLITDLADTFKAVFVHDLELYDNQFRLLLGKDNTSDAEAKIPIFESALLRKSESESKIEKINIPYNTLLPPIISEEEVKLQSPAEVVKRAVILCLMASRSHGTDSKFILNFLKVNKLYNLLTELEKDFLYMPKPSEDLLVDYSWKYECSNILLWSLGFFEKLETFKEKCEPKKIIDLINSKGVAGLLSQASYRSAKDILDAADLSYRTHWIVKNIKSEIYKDLINPEVAYERHYTFNWLIRYMNNNWSDIQT